MAEIVPFQRISRHELAVRSGIRTVYIMAAQEDIY
jgi:hypothetical protein